jgi:hypothetical protein
MKAYLPMRLLCLALLLLAVAPASAAPQDCGGPQPVELTPIARTQVRQKGGPPESRDTLLLEISVLPSGVPGEVRVLRSSGLPSWDRSWMQLILREWRWRPMNCTRAVTGKLELVTARQLRY